jgi:putative hydrolase of the HAD superfamily
VERQNAKLTALGISTLFDVVLISEAEGIRKPDRAIFDMAVNRCGVSPTEAMFVGDHPEVDIAGAQAAGLVPVWKRVPYWQMTLENVLVIDALTELLPICRNG